MRRLTVYGRSLSNKAYRLIKVRQRDQAVLSDAQINDRSGPLWRRASHAPTFLRQVRAMRGEYARGKNKIAAMLRRGGWGVSAATPGHVITALLKEHKIARIRPGAMPGAARGALWARRRRPFAQSAPANQQGLSLLIMY